MPLESGQLADSLSHSFWPGTIGKSWVANSLCANAQRLPPEAEYRVLDLGAGAGSGWLHVLRESPTMRLTLWDANPSWYGSESVPLGDRLEYVHSLASLTPHTYDAVTSFSVAEHVADLADHLRLFQHYLSEGGLGVVLWDDGHFRPTINLARPLSTASLAAKESAKWAASALLGDRIPPSHFQRRRSMRDVHQAASEVGLRIVGSTFVGLGGVKSAFASIPGSRALAAMNSWLDLERTVLDAVGDTEEHWPELEMLFGSRMVLVTPSGA